jgi:hypothetical protein
MVNPLGRLDGNANLLEEIFCLVFEEIQEGGVVGWWGKRVRRG